VVVTNTTFYDFAVVGVLLSIRVGVNTIYNLAIDVLLSRSHNEDRFWEMLAN